MYFGTVPGTRYFDPFDHNVNVEKRKRKNGNLNVQDSRSSAMPKSAVTLIKKSHLSLFKIVTEDDRIKPERFISYS